MKIVDPASIESALQAVNAPHKEAVSRYEVAVGRDHEGEPAVFVYIVLKDQEVDRMWDDRETLREKVRALLLILAGPEFYPYVRFRTVSEVEEAAETSP